MNYSSNHNYEFRIINYSSNHSMNYELWILELPTFNIFCYIGHCLTFEDRTLHACSFLLTIVISRSGGMLPSVKDGGEVTNRDDEPWKKSPILHTRSRWQWQTSPLHHLLSRTQSENG